MSAAGHAHDAFPDYVIVPEPPRPDDVRPAEAPPVAVEPPTPSRPASPVLPLLLLVVGLAAAAVWFVGVPQLTKPAAVERGCEVIVLQSGNTKCVTNPRAGSKAAKKSAAKQ